MYGLPVGDRTQAERNANPVTTTRESKESAPKIFTKFKVFAFFRYPNM